MREGKLAEPVFKRSVLRQLKNSYSEVTQAAGSTFACDGIIGIAENELLATAVSSYTVNASESIWFVINAAANKLAATKGAKPLAIALSVFLPAELEEKDLKNMMCTVDETCTHLHINVIDIDIQVSEAVNMPIFTVTAYGSTTREKVTGLSGAKAGQDIVVTKSIGLEGVALLSMEHEERLLKRYTQSFIYQAQSFANYASILREVAVAVSHGATAMHAIQQGGVLAALWELAGASKVGLTVDLKHIPIKQETVEICEFFGYNPYQFMSTGSLMVATDDGFSLVRKLEAEGIPASVIGKITDSNDKVILRDDETRYIDLPGMDEIFKRRD